MNEWELPIANFGVYSLMSWWRHQMEAFSTLLAICAGNSPATGKFSSQRPVTRSFDVFFICAWTNGWANHRDAGDLRRHCAHYGTTVMCPLWSYDKGSVIQTFNILFCITLQKFLNKQLSCQWCVTLWCSCDFTVMVSGSVTSLDLGVSSPPHSVAPVSLPAALITTLNSGCQVR